MIPGFIAVFTIMFDLGVAIVPVGDSSSRVVAFLRLPKVAA